jgi:sucrose phosphorylase
MFSSATRSKVAELLKQVYPEHNSEALIQAIEKQLATFSKSKSASHGEGEELWSERDSLLITYADSLHRSGEAPLATLKGFLDSHAVGKIKNVHLLPFYPYTSDDGFSVSDYLQVNPEVGTWNNVIALADKFTLMFDLVLNHCSASHPWFKGYVQGDERYKDYFIESDPALDHSMVVRPRSLPLLTPVETSRGVKHVWTTFSADQIDLNFASPAILHEMIDILLRYLEYGAKIVRFDAPTYLWKKLGTSCVSLPETHAVMKIFRAVMETASPQSVVLTETNVPHLENISYFGAGDEAHIVYNFTLPPLLLHAMKTRNSSHLQRWARSLNNIPEGCTFLNFTASHDGIGVRGLKDIVPDSEITRLVEQVQQLGGKVSTRRLSDGSDAPYEMNISYFDALGEGRDDASPEVRDRFLSTQMIAMAFRGVPALYIQSLIGGRNDYKGLEATGRARSINRKRWEYAELMSHLETPSAHYLFTNILRALEARCEIPALHPLGNQSVLETDEGLFAIYREHNGSRFISVTNLTEKESEFQAQELSGMSDVFTKVPVETKLPVPAFKTVWCVK